MTNDQKRNVTRRIVRLIVSFSAAGVAQSVIENNIDKEDQSTFSKVTTAIGSMTIGAFVGHTTADYVDKQIEQIFEATNTDAVVEDTTPTDES